MKSYYYGNFTTVTSKVALREWFSSEVYATFNVSNVVPEDVGMLVHSIHKFLPCNKKMREFFTTRNRDVCLIGRFREGAFVVGTEVVSGRVDYSGTFSIRETHEKHGFGERITFANAKDANGKFWSTNKYLLDGKNKYTKVAKQLNIMRFAGQFADDKISGLGELTHFQNGNRYTHTGYFSNNRAHGRGYRTVGKGVYVGDFDMGVLGYGWVYVDPAFQEEYNCVFYGGELVPQGRSKYRGACTGWALDTEGYSYRGTFVEGYFVRGEKVYLSTKKEREDFVLAQLHTMDICLKYGKTIHRDYSFTHLFTTTVREGGIDYFVNLRSGDAPCPYKFVRSCGVFKSISLKDKKIFSTHRFGVRSHRPGVRLTSPVYLKRNACIRTGAAIDTKGTVHRGTFSSMRLIRGEMTELNGIHTKGTWAPKFTGTVTNAKGGETHFQNGKKNTYEEKKRLRLVRKEKARVVQRWYRCLVVRRKARLEGFCRWFDQKNMSQCLEMTCARNTIVAFLQNAILKCRAREVPTSPTSIRAIDRDFEDISFTPFPYSGVVRQRVMQAMPKFNRGRAAKGEKMVRSREYLMNGWWREHALALHREQCCGERWVETEGGETRQVVTCKPCLKNKECPHWKTITLDTMKMMVIKYILRRR